ncbi:NADH-cytochrome b5 reductase [Blyttiomyces sp. JEL0837]|nr:NADH-cytochrome b5 reductase [Blyttiomyces sp. JEL0837]
MAMLLAATAAGMFAFDLYYSSTLKKERTDKLTPNEFHEFELEQIIVLTHDTSLFRFKAAPAGDTTNPGVLAPNHVIVKDDSCQIARSYTPLTYGSSFFDLLVKRYSAGSVSRMIHDLHVGEKLSVRGPLRTIEYKPNSAKRLLLIAGGTGITPMYQLIKQILKDATDEAEMVLVYGSRSEKDILLRNELSFLQQNFPERLIVEHVLQDGGPVGWKGSKGLITGELIKKFIPQHGSFLTLVCGPDAMIKTLAGSRMGEDKNRELGGVLKAINMTTESVFVL